MTREVFQNSQAPLKTDISSAANTSSCFPRWTGASSLSRDSYQISMLLHEEKAAQTEADTVAPQPPHTWDTWVESEVPTHTSTCHREGWKRRCSKTGFCKPFKKGTVKGNPCFVSFRQFCA